MITTPSLLDPQLAPAGCHAMKILVHAPHASVFAEEFPDKADIDRLQAEIFAIIKEKTGLDAASHSLFTIRATPRTLLERTGNEEGAMYGFDSALGQVGPGRPPWPPGLTTCYGLGIITALPTALSAAPYPVVLPPISSQVNKFHHRDTEFPEHAIQIMRPPLCPGDEIESS